MEVKHRIAFIVRFDRLLSQEIYEKQFNDQVTFNTLSKAMLGGLVPAQTLFVANSYDRPAGLVRWSFDQACQAGGEPYSGCQSAGGACESMAKRNDGCWSVAADPADEEPVVLLLLLLLRKLLQTKI